MAPSHARHVQFCARVSAQRCRPQTSWRSRRPRSRTWPETQRSPPRACCGSEAVRCACQFHTVSHCFLSLAFAYSTLAHLLVVPAASVGPVPANDAQQCRWQLGQSVKSLIVGTAQQLPTVLALMARARSLNPQPRTPSRPAGSLPDALLHCPLRAAQGSWRAALILFSSPCVVADGRPRRAGHGHGRPGEPRPQRGRLLDERGAHHLRGDWRAGAVAPSAARERLMSWESSGGRVHKLCGSLADL